MKPLLILFTCFPLIVLAQPSSPSSKPAKPDVRISSAPSSARPGNGESLSDSKRKLLAAIKKESCKVDPPADASSKAEVPYYKLLVTRIRPFYFLPSFLSDDPSFKTLKSQVKVRIADSGELLEVVLVSSSGNDHFDSAVLTTIKDAAPGFCPPPPSLRTSIQQQGILLEFTP